MNGKGDVLRLAVCELYAASYGIPGRRPFHTNAQDVMTASLQSSQPPKVLAVDISSLDTKLVTAKDDNKLFGLVYNNTSGMA